MKQKTTLRKFRDFWLTPFLTGVFFATGYEFTQRQLSSSKLIRREESIQAPDNYYSTNHDSKFFQPLSKESSTDKMFNPEQTNEEISEKSKIAEESEKLLPGKTSFKKFPKQERQEFINNEISYTDNLSDQNAKFIENLFNSLPDP